MAKIPRILYLEDDPDDVELLRIALARNRLDCEVIALDGRAAFLAALDAGTPDLILCDGSLPGIDGPTAVALAKARLPRVPFILVSGAPDPTAVEACRRLGAADCLVKGDRAAIVRAVRLALEKSPAPPGSNDPAATRD